MSKGNPLYVGAASVQAFTKSGSLALDRLMDEVTDGLGQITPKTAIIHPWQSMYLEAIVAALPAHGYLVMTEGIYELASAVDIDKASIIGAGKVALNSTGAAMTVSGSNVMLVGLWFEQMNEDNDRSLTVSGDNCGIKTCVFSGPQDYGVVVTGDDVAVCGCRFLGNSAHSGAGDADIYYETTASNGIVSCTMRSGSRQYTLDYKTGTSMSEAANGPTAVINVRP